MTEPTQPAHKAAPAHSAPADTLTPHTIRTDRPCARCGFNLFGQPIVREPYYNLTAARCPECGQLAALQEYPALGKWADRWAKLLAALWILCLLVAMLAHFGPTLGLTVAPIEFARERLSFNIATQYQTFKDAQLEGPANPNSYGANSWATIDRAWWETNRAEILGTSGGASALFNMETLPFAVPLAIGTFAFGAFWSTVLLGARRRTALLVALIPPITALIFAAVSTGSYTYGATVLTARDAAGDHIRPYFIAASAALIAASLALGVFLGRKLARLLVRLALPPRTRSALAILWTRDGLPPPSARP